MTTLLEEKDHKKEEEGYYEVDRPIDSSPPAMLTLEQAHKLANGRLFELIKGRMVFKIPDYDHAQTQSLLCIELGAYLKRTLLLAAY